MARIARIVVPGIPHHITQRGNRLMETFFSDKDYTKYLSVMAHWCKVHNVDIWCYCLMPNHVHLIAVPGTEKALSLAISKAHPRPKKRTLNRGTIILTTDIYWNLRPDTKKALMLAKRQLPELVCDAVNLEGINFTVPEIQTLLNGITIGGRRLSDQQIPLNQAEAWRTLFQWIENKEFVVSKEQVYALHEIAGKDAALERGAFRSGGVTIAGTQYMPPQPYQLVDGFDSMVMDIEEFNDIYDQAINVFLTMARCQFFYDVNKRMGRFMMNGILLQNGYPTINLPAKRQLEFNTLMIEYHDNADQKPMNEFLRSCLDSRIIGIMQE